MARFMREYGWISNEYILDYMTPQQLDNKLKALGYVNKKYPKLNFEDL